MHKTQVIADREIVFQGRVIGMTYFPKRVHRSGIIIEQRTSVCVGFSSGETKHYIGWGRIAVVCAFHLHKGSEIGLVARLSNMKILNDGAVSYTRTIERMYSRDSGNFVNPYLEALKEEMCERDALNIMRAIMTRGYQGSTEFGNAIVCNPR